MKILASNDDGIHAPGLKAMVEAISALSFVKVVDVVAPDRDCSAASHSLTLDKPLHPMLLEPGRTCVNGTPTDCVHLAITGYLDYTPDLVVSGVNNGANLGDDVLYSGTIAAAMEGRSLGLPSIAVSLSFEGGADTVKYFETAALVTADILKYCQVYPLPKTTVLNVNVPNVPFDNIRGFEVTRLGHRHQAEPVIPTLDPRGKQVFWIGPAGESQDAGPGTDFYAISQQRVSLTPLKIDLTDEQVIPDLTQWASAFSLHALPE